MSITYINSWLIILSASLPNEIEIKENVKPVLCHSIDMII